jgi:hypothetical protein
MISRCRSSIVPRIHDPITIGLAQRGTALALEVLDRRDRQRRRRLEHGTQTAIVGEGKISV